MIRAHLIEKIDCADALGEGVLWRASDHTVWWTDIQGSRLHRLCWRRKTLETFATPERLCSFGFIEGRDDILLAAFETGFAVFEPESGDAFWRHKPADLRPGLRLNDGRADPAGRFWAGSMTERRLEEGAPPDGKLYRLDEDGRARAVLGGVHISNGLCWSPDGRRIYFADSLLGEIRRADFDALTGECGPFSLFAKFENGSPDGAVVDAEGRLWTALWGAGRVACLSEDGAETYSLAIPAPQPTCPAFGNEDGRLLLFVTSARDELSEQELRDAPESGSLFVYETNVAGMPVTRVSMRK